MVLPRVCVCDLCEGCRFGTAAARGCEALVDEVVDVDCQGGRFGEVEWV